MRLYKHILFVLILSLFTTGIQAQRTVIYTNEDVDYNTASELFRKEKFGAAQKYYNKVIAKQDPQSLLRLESEYYAAICAIELFNKDGELLLKEFIAHHPESPY